MLAGRAAHAGLGARVRRRSPHLTRGAERPPVNGDFRDRVHVGVDVGVGVAAAVGDLLADGRDATHSSSPSPSPMLASPTPPRSPLGCSARARPSPHHLRPVRDVEPEPPHSCDTCGMLAEGATSHNCRCPSAHRTSTATPAQRRRQRADLTRTRTSDDHRTHPRSARLVLGHQQLRPGTSPNNGTYEDAYDIWLNGIADPDAGQRRARRSGPATTGRPRAGRRRPRSRSGGQSWTAWKGNAGHMAFVAKFELHRHPPAAAAVPPVGDPSGAGCAVELHAQPGGRRGRRSDFTNGAPATFSFSKNFRGELISSTGGPVTHRLARLRVSRRWISDSGHRCPGRGRRAEPDRTWLASGAARLPVTVDLPAIARRRVAPPLAPA